MEGREEISTQESTTASSQSVVYLIENLGFWVEHTIGRKSA